MNELLAGKKMKITAVLLGIVTALQLAEIITPEQAKSAVQLLAAFGFYAAKKAIEKAEVN